MFTIEDQFALLMSADGADPDGGAGGGAAAGDGASSHGQQDGGAGGDGGASPSAGGEGGDAPAAPAAGTPYRPEGVPETMLGDDDRGTIDKMAATIKGYRDKEGRVEIPKDAAGYADFSKADVADELKDYVGQLADDPIYKALSDKALESKWDPAIVQQVTLTALDAAQRGGLLTDMIDESAEQAALVPESLKDAPEAKRTEAAKARVDAAEDFINLQIQNKTLPKEVGEHAAKMLLDTADGVKFLESYMQAVTGGQGANPVTTGQGGGGDTRDALKAEMAKPEMQPSHPRFDKAAFAALQERYKAAVD